jgi:hypothetical protein
MNFFWFAPPEIEYVSCDSFQEVDWRSFKARMCFCMSSEKRPFPVFSFSIAEAYDFIR